MTTEEMIGGTKTMDVSIDDDAELLALDKLLSETDKDEDELDICDKPSTSKSAPCLREDSTFAEAFSYELDLPPSKIQEAADRATAAAEELDSSDDEEIKNFLERKYNQYGCDINKRLKESRAAQHDVHVASEVNLAMTAKSHIPEASTSQGPLKNPHNPIKRESLLSTSFQRAAAPQVRHIPAAQSASAAPIVPTFTDPVFGLRIINPLVSSALLVERMSGRKSVSFSDLAFHTQRGDLSKDWVIAGVLVHKSPVRTTKTGTPYSIWRLTDLRGVIKMASIFLFKGAHKELWKTSQGTCLAVLNASIFEKRADSGDVACLSIDTAKKVMVLGQSKDFGMCKSKKRNGDACTAVVNLSECDFCIYHMKQEFGNMSRRSELQSATAGRGLNELRNKVLGKSEVFYGGQSFSAVPAKKSAKLIKKDKNRISTLSDYGISPFAGSVNHTRKQKIPNTEVPYAARDGPVSKLAANVEAGTKQRLKDVERLKILQAESDFHANASKEKSSETLKPKESGISLLSNQSSPASSSSTSVVRPARPSSPPEKFKNRQFSFSSSSPQLSRENFCIEVNVGGRQANLAKAKATQILKQKPIEKMNPNSTRGSKTGKRRAIDELNDKFMCSDEKRQKMEKEEHEKERQSRLERIINATSSHTNLIDMREEQEKEKYFNKLEKKEALEEKMLNTYKMPCKAVICQRCKYTAFSAADRCKEEKHPLRVVDAEKRFFACKDCGNRTATVFRFPKNSCKNCKGSRWERTAMIRERKLCNTREELSVRGNEETFIGSLAGNANLNLLVPDE